MSQTMKKFRLLFLFLLPLTAFGQDASVCFCNISGPVDICPGVYYRYYTDPDLDPGAFSKGWAVAGGTIDLSRTTDSETYISWNANASVRVVILDETFRNNVNPDPDGFPIFEDSQLIYKLLVGATPSPPTPTIASVLQCYAGNMTLSASGGSEGNYRWYDPSGSLVNGATGSSLTVFVGQGETKVYKVSVVNSSGCDESAKTSTGVAVLPAVPAPFGNSYSFCGPQTVTLVVDPNNGDFQNTTTQWISSDEITSLPDVPVFHSVSLTTNWFSSPTDNASLQEGSSYMTDLSADRTFYVSNFVLLSDQAGACESTRSEVNVTIRQLPVVTFNSTSLSVCSGTELDIAPSSSTAETVDWTVTGNDGWISGFQNQQYANAIRETYSNSSTANGQVNYSVTPIGNGCGGIPVSITVTVHSTPATPSAQSQVILFNTGTTLSGAAIDNISYHWYDGSGNFIIDGSSYGTPALQQNTTYQYEAFNVNTSCKSAKNSFSIIANHPPQVSFDPDKTVIYPVSSVVFNASATDQDGSINSVLWSQTSGQSLHLSGTGTGALTVLNPPVGSYSFQFTAQDNYQATAGGTVQLTVDYPPNNFNYVMEDVVTIDNVADPNAINSFTVDQKNTKTTYIDGLGRPMQVVNMQLSPGKVDVVQPVVYDGFGREPRKYLPISVESNGYYKPNEQIIDLNTASPTYGNYAGIAQPFYSTGGKVVSDARPYAETIFEPSPLNRLLQQFGPGQDWKTNDKSVGQQYQTNLANDVYLFVYDASSGLVSLPADSHYGAGQLHAKVTTDEHGNDVVEYIDKLNHTVCKKVQYKTDTNGNKLYASTYYIYDDVGNLVVVLPPEAVKKFTSQQ